MTPVTLDWARTLLAVADVIALVILCNGMLQNAIYVGQLFVAFFVLRRRRRSTEETPLGTWWQMAESTIPISLLVPAYNEEKTIVDNVRSLLALRYPNCEIIVVNDGSQDETLVRLIDTFELEPVQRAHEQTLQHQTLRQVYGSRRFPHLIVLDKDNGGKADALNAGINLCRNPLFCAIDADSMLEADALLRAVQPFVEDPDRVVAVGGTVRIANGNLIEGGRVVQTRLPGGVLELFQIVEYLRAFLMARVALAEMGTMMLISGAFGIFRRQVVVDAGGYSADTVGEDMELIVKLHRYLSDGKVPYEIRFVPDPVCWTQAPRDLRSLARQRMRWQRGALETFFRHMDMMVRPRYGRAGFLGFLSVLITDVLGPPLEVLGYICVPIFWYFGVLSEPFLFAYLGLTFGWGIFVSVGSLILEEMELRRFGSPRDLCTLTAVAVLENIGYRQLHNIWRVAGWVQFLFGASHWHQAKRSEFQAA